MRARGRLRDEAAPLTSARLSGLVAAHQPGASVVRKLVEVDKVALPGAFMRSERAVLTTPSRRVRL